MKIIYNKLIPFKGYIAMNLFGIIFVRKEYKKIANEYVINHESIHTKQIQELGYIFFYIWYLIEYLIKLIIYMNHNKAYLNISFEKEAYNNEFDLDYLNNRKHYNWIKLIK